MILTDITRFAKTDKTIFGKLAALALAALLAVSLNSALQPGFAFADEGKGAIVEWPGASPDDDKGTEVQKEPQNVYVYLDSGLTGDELEQAKRDGIVNSSGWITVGVIQLEIDPATAYEDKAEAERTFAISSEMQEKIGEALKDIEFLDGREIDLSQVEWMHLKAERGANDYLEAADAWTWHLDGKVVKKPAPGNPDDGSHEGDENQGGNNTPGNNGPNEPQRPTVPEPENPGSITVPSVAVPTPQRPNQPQANPQTPAAPNDNNTSDGGFAAGERTIVSEPEPDAAPAPEPEEASEPVAPTSTIDNDAVPMAARSNASIEEEEVPLGAFDAPVDPAPWVAGMGAIGTALWGVVAVRRRLIMTQKLASFESQVLGNPASEAETVVAPNAQQTF